MDRNHLAVRIEEGAAAPVNGSRRGRNSLVAPVGQHAARRARPPPAPPALAFGAAVGAAPPLRRDGRRRLAAVGTGAPVDARPTVVDVGRASTGAPVPT